MKKYLFLAATAFMFAACSNNEVDAPQVTTEGPQAVDFDVYAASATRAGDPGIQTTTTLQATGKGFGVFAQYSNSTTTTDGAYDNATNPTNFMWNEHVTYSSSAWTYSPLKYWPNETTNDSQTTDGAATSAKTDKLSFFAYAPYVAEVASTYTGKIVGPTYSTDPTISDSKITANGGGVEAIIANNTTGNDPWVRYAVGTMPSESVDLLWGVAPAGGLKYTNVAGTETKIDEGMPLVDLIKPSKDQKIKFLFKHALARIGMTVVAAVDQISAGGKIDAATKIAVKEVTITETTPSKKLATVGTLNLKNTAASKALWTNYSGVFTGTVNNGTNGELNPNIAYDTDATTTFAKTTPWTGVTTTETPVIADNKYYMVIPAGHYDTQLEVTITYYVITKDDKLADGYSEVENVITKKVTIPGLTNNKAYNLKLILGLTSVKLDAEVADWEVDGSTEVNLPRNNE